MRAGSFDQDVKNLQKKAGLTDAQVKSRLARLDPKIIELARSDAVNPWVPAIGAISPEFYKELYRDSSQQGRAQAEDTLILIRDFRSAQKSRISWRWFSPRACRYLKNMTIFIRGAAMTSTISRCLYAGLIR